MNHKVKALDTYTRLKVKDKVLRKIVPEGTEFEVDDSRLKVLLGANSYREAFVEEIKNKKNKKMKEAKFADKATMVAEDVPMEEGNFHHGEPIPVPVDPTITDK